MSSCACTVSASWVDDGEKTLTALQRAIAARTKFLGETGKAATVATAINVLRSLRAGTSTVRKNRPMVFGDRWLVDVEESPYMASWAYPPRQGTRGRRVVRTGPGGRALDKVGAGGKRLVNLAGPYVKGEVLHVYRLRIYNQKAVVPGAWLDCYVTARAEDDVRKWASLRVQRRIGQYRGISKRALSLAMHRLHVKGADSSHDVVPGVRKLIESIVSVREYGSGWSSGECGITVRDDLPMAALALKNGTAGVEIALRKAANSTAAIIKRKVASTGFGHQIATPFPEVSSRRAST